MDSILRGVGTSSSAKKEISGSENGKEKVQIDYKGFKYLGICSKKDAPFICIEPWYNTADKINSDGYLKNKEDIIAALAMSPVGKGE